MTQNEQEKQTLLFNELIQHYIKEQLTELKSSKKDKSKSFIYLESKTLHVLIVSLLMHMQSTNKPVTANTSESEPILEEVMKEIDIMMTNHKQTYEQILDLLRKDP